MDALYHIGREMSGIERKLESFGREVSELLREMSARITALEQHQRASTARNVVPFRRLDDIDGSDSVS